MGPVCDYKCFMHFFFLRYYKWCIILRLYSRYFFYHFKSISRNENNVNKMISPIYFKPYSQKKDIMSMKLLAF